MSKASLEFNQVTKKYKSKFALDCINLKFNSVEKTAILGCNGAGKSTFLNIATGLTQATQGSVKIMGLNPLSVHSKNSFAFLPQVLKFPAYLKVKDVLAVVEGHFEESIDKEILYRLELVGLMNKYCYGLSGGEERKLGFALSLIGTRPLLILDEPTANVDVVARKEIYSILKASLKHKEKSLIFSSHEMSEVELLADRIVVLNKGQVVADGTVNEIKKAFSLTKVSFDSSDHYRGFKSVKSFEKSEFGYTLYGECGDAMIKEVVQECAEFANLKVEKTSLEEVFINHWSEK